MPDVFEGLAKFVLGRLEQSLVGQWLRLLFELALSALATYLGVGGTVIAAGGSWLIGHGIGMGAAALALIAVVQRDEHAKLLRGMLFAFPSQLLRQLAASSFSSMEPGAKPASQPSPKSANPQRSPAPASPDEPPPSGPEVGGGG